MWKRERMVLERQMQNACWGYKPDIHSRQVLDSFPLHWVLVNYGHNLMLGHVVAWGSFCHSRPQKAQGNFDRPEIHCRKLFYGPCLVQGLPA